MCYSVCLTREQDLYKKNNMLGHISRVKDYASTTSTSTLREHLLAAHNISSNEPDDEVDESGNVSVTDGAANTSHITGKQGKSSGAKQVKLSFKQKIANFEPSTSKYELARDLTIWAALDLEPFMFTDKRGARFFFEKNLPAILLPSRNTLARKALYDVYESVMQQIKNEIALIGERAVCVTFDGWSDKYRRYPYIGLKLAFVNNEWNYRLITVSLKVLEKHTGENMASHVREELRNLGLNLSINELFTTHDGAANMIKASRLLKSSQYQHCVAHGLHLLLMTDGINTIPDLVDLLTRLKSAIQRLDAKGYLVDGAKAKTADKEKMILFNEKIARIQEVLNADEAVTFLPDNDEDNRNNLPEERLYSDGQAESLVRLRPPKQHQTLKTSNVTRWNSTLYMVDSALCLWGEMNEALKVNGDRELCLPEEDKIVLMELKKFLKPFGDLTELVSTEAPHLSLIPLIVREIKDAAMAVDEHEEDVITLLKQAVLTHVDKRITISETTKVVSLLDPFVKRMMATELGVHEAKKLLQEHTLKAVQRLHAYQNAQSQSVRQPNEGETSRSFRTIASSAASSQSQSAVTNLAVVGTAREFRVTSGLSGSSASKGQAEVADLSKKKKLLEKFAQCDASYDLNVQIENEVNTYIALDTIISDESPLCFWRSQSNSFANLSVLAKSYLCISASSVGVEGMFSTAGLILNCKRSQMAPYRANMLSFIHDNYSKYFPTSRPGTKKQQSKATLDESDSD
jgi:hypothetical protein